MKQRVIIDWNRYPKEQKSIHEKAKESFRLQLGNETEENHELIERQYKEGIQFLEQNKEKYLPQGIFVTHPSGDQTKLYFLFCIKEECNGTLLEQCYHDLWCNAYLMETRKQFLKERFIYGPGYYDETTETIKDILTILKPYELPVSFKNNCLSPTKTLIGYVIIGKEEEEKKLQKCKQCKGNKKNCHYCID